MVCPKNGTLIQLSLPSGYAKDENKVRWSAILGVFSLNFKVGKLLLDGSRIYKSRQRHFTIITGVTLMLIRVREMRKKENIL